MHYVAERTPVSLIALDEACLNAIPLNGARELVYLLASLLSSTRQWERAELSFFPKDR